MRTIAAFVRLPADDRWLVLRCWQRLIAATLGVRLWPLESLVTTMDERIARRGACGGSPEHALRLCAAAARRVWPRPTCLVTALTSYELLRERGWPVVLVIGGHRMGDDFKAHAWLERGDVVVLGAPIDAYRPIWRWPGGSVGSSELNLLRT